MKENNTLMLIFLAVIMAPGLACFFSAMAGVKNPIDIALDTKVQQSYASLEPKSNKKQPKRIAKRVVRKGDTKKSSEVNR